MVMLARLHYKVDDDGAYNILMEESVRLMEDLNTMQSLIYFQQGINYLVHVFNRDISLLATRKFFDALGLKALVLWSRRARILCNTVVKGTVSRNFFHQSIPLGPMILGLKPFRILIRIRGDIRFLGLAIQIF
jgi:hypothetical protein